jgi:hypothetical protein
MGRKSTIVTPLASQMNMAITVDKEVTALNFLLAGESLYALRNQSLSLVWQNAPKFHSQSWSSPLIPNWFICIKSHALSTNPYATVCVHSIALGPNTQTPSCNQQCHAFLLAKYWVLPHFCVSPCLSSRPSTQQMLSSRVNVLGLPMQRSSVRSTQSFWNALYHTETCFLIIICFP